MKHGVHISPVERDNIAREAFVIYNQHTTQSEGLFAVEIEFDVSKPTARNLVNRGRDLQPKKVPTP